MGGGRIISRGGPIGDFPKIFSRGWPKVVKFVFYRSKLKKQPFFANDFKIQGGQGCLATALIRVLVRFAYLATLILVMMLTSLQLLSVHYNPSSDGCARDAEQNRMRKESLVNKRSQEKTERHLYLSIK